MLLAVEFFLKSCRTIGILLLVLGESEMHMNININININNININNISTALHEYY